MFVIQNVFETILKKKVNEDLCLCNNMPLSSSSLNDSTSTCVFVFLSIYTQYKRWRYGQHGPYDNQMTKLTLTHTHTYVCVFWWRGKGGTSKMHGHRESFKDLN